MKRSGKIVVLAHCLLNANAKVRPYATFPGVLTEAVCRFIEEGVGLVQLPCPESSYLGINRWGMSREQYDHPNFRRHCRAILEPVFDELETFRDAGYELIGVVGVENSPNCGVNRTPVGLQGGSLSCHGGDPDKDLKIISGSGVFMALFKEMMKERNFKIRMMAVDESSPSTIICQEGDGGRV